MLLKCMSTNTNNNKTHPCLVHNINNGTELATVGAISNVGNTARLNKPVKSLEHQKSN